MDQELPVDILSRKEEITKDFLQLTNKHLDDLVQSRAPRRFHPRDFAALLFIHPRHLTNTIKLTTGKSPCDIMEEKIADAAKHFLSETSLSVADIGERFGYNESTNFVKFFKGMTGVTPLRYRKQGMSAM